jgi:hypothetical protein
MSPWDACPTLGSSVAFLMQIAMAVGLASSYPANAVLIRLGRGSDVTCGSEWG